MDGSGLLSSWIQSSILNALCSRNEQSLVIRKSVEEWYEWCLFFSIHFHSCYWSWKHGTYTYRRLCCEFSYVREKKGKDKMSESQSFKQYPLHVGCLSWLCTKECSQNTSQVRAFHCPENIFLTGLKYTRYKFVLPEKNTFPGSLIWK